MGQDRTGEYPHPKYLGVTLDDVMLQIAYTQDEGGYTQQSIKKVVKIQNGEQMLIQSEQQHWH